MKKMVFSLSVRYIMTLWDFWAGLSVALCNYAITLYSNVVVSCHWIMASGWLPSTCNRSGIKQACMHLQPPVKFQQLHRNGTGQALTLFCLQRERRVTSAHDAPVTRLALNAPRSPPCDVDSNAFCAAAIWKHWNVPRVYAELWVHLLK